MTLTVTTKSTSIVGSTPKTRSKPEVKSKKSKNPDNEASKIPEKDHPVAFESPRLDGPNHGRTINHYLERVRNTLWCV